MNIKQLKNSLPYLFKAKVSTLIWAPHGVGKSQAIKQFCQENKYRFFDLRLGSVEVGDLLGLADFKIDSNGERIATKFCTPDWLVDLIDYCNKNPNSAAVIFLDEINRGRRDVLQCVFQMALDKRHHMTEFPPNLHVVGAANPSTSDYIVADIGDKAFMDRFAHIKLVPSTKDWLEYQESRGMSKAMLNHIKLQPELLTGKTEDFDIERQPSHRSNEKLDEIYKLEPPHDILQEIAFGLIGKPAAIAFLESLKQIDKPIAAFDVLNNFSKVMEDFGTTVEEKLKEYSNPETGGRHDLLKVTCDELKKLLEKDSKPLKDKQVKNLLKFLKTAPTDLIFPLMREIYLLENCREHLDNDVEMTEMLQKKVQDKSAKTS